LQELEHTVVKWARQQYGLAAESLAAQYEAMTGTLTASELIRKVLSQHPPFETKDVHALTDSLMITADGECNCLAQPRAVLDMALRFACALDDLGDSRLLVVLEAAEMHAALQAESLALQLSELRARPEMILRFQELNCYQVSFSTCFHGHRQSRRLHGESSLQP
jgi:hypothetical protein